MAAASIGAAELSFTLHWPLAAGLFHFQNRIMDDTALLLPFVLICAAWRRHRPPSIIPNMIPPPQNMNSGLRVTRSLCLLLLAFLPLSSRAEQWTEVRSPNFVVATDAGEKRGRDAAFRFEQIRA